MSRYLVTYVDALNNVAVAADSPSKRDAGSAAWRELIERVGADAALADYRQTVSVLADGAEVRFVVVRTNAAQPVPVCSYGQLATALSAVAALAPLTDFSYGVRTEVRVAAELER